MENSTRIISTARRVPWIAGCPLSALLITLERACPRDQSLSPHPNHSQSFPHRPYPYPHPSLPLLLFVTILNQNPRALPLPGSPACTPPHSTLCTSLPGQVASYLHLEPAARAQRALGPEFVHKALKGNSRVGGIRGTTNSPLGIPWALTRSPYGSQVNPHETSKHLVSEMGRELLGWRVWPGLSQGDSGWDMVVMPGQAWSYGL